MWPCTLQQDPRLRNSCAEGCRSWLLNGLFTLAPQHTTIGSVDDSQALNADACSVPELVHSWYNGVPRRRRAGDAMLVAPSAVGLQMAATKPDTKWRNKI